MTYINIKGGVTLKRNITFILFLLGIVVIFLVYRRYPLDSNPRTIQQVAKKTFNCPDAQIVQLSQDSAKSTQVLSDRYDTYFTPQALETFLKQRYSDKYHFLAKESNRQIIFEKMTIKKDLNSPITYYFDITLKGKSTTSSTHTLKVTGSAQFINNKIISIDFEDQDLVALLAP